MIQVDIESKKGRPSRSIGWLPAVPQVHDLLWIDSDCWKVTHVTYELNEGLVRLTVKEYDGD